MSEGFDPGFEIPGDVDFDPVPVPAGTWSSRAPAWAMAAQALDLRDQTHLRNGLHLRVMTSPLLGLPITPFRVVDKTVDLESLRSEIVWTDDSPRPVRLIPPFDVTPDRPVIGWLPPATDDTCCWLEVSANIPAGGGLEVSAMTATSRGPRAVASRSNRPYRVWASSIEHVRVEGTGTIKEVSWLPSNVIGGTLIKLMALPVARPHPRYVALDNGVLLAAARVTRGAPQRRALYDSDSPPATPATLPIPAEVARVARLAGVLAPDVLRLVDQEVLDPWLLTTVNDVVNEHGTEIGTSTHNCLDAVFNGTIDHGLARWLGFLDNDVLTPGDAGIDARVVTAVFAPDWAQLAARGLLLSIPPDAVVADLTALRERYPEFDALGDLAGTVDGPYLDIGVMAAYSPNLMLDRPPAPTVVSVTDRPTRTSDILPSAVSAWLPRVPPDAARETKIVLDDLVPGAALALARDDLTGGGPVVLNVPSAAPDFNQPLVASVVVTDDASSADLGSLGERGCPAGAVRYLVAQADWFGRWSGWADAELAAGVRPRPPMPAVRAWASQAEVPLDDVGGPLAGTISATIPVPQPSELPPGGNLITSLRFQVTDAAHDTTTTQIPVDDPSSPPSELAVEVPGPTLMPGTSTTISVSAHWTDTAFERSDPSTPINLTIWDPRPPAPVVIDPTLRYTARPDVTGRARVEITWEAASPQEWFRVYYADETTLHMRFAALAEAGDAAADALIDALDEATTAVERSVVWTAHGAMLPRALFTLITPTPLPRSAPEMHLEHSVSGSLRTLSLYRIVAVSGANVDVDFAASPVVPYAVSNTLPPPQPHLVARILDPTVTGTADPVAELTITVPRGSRRAVEYRLRRSRVSAADPLLMPVVATGVLDPPPDPTVDPDSGEPTEPPAPHVEVITDSGPTTLEADGLLRSWNTYTWRVEVRGEPEPGRGPPGTWSQPSMPAGASVVPLAGPPTPTISTARRDGSTLQLGVDVPTDLRGGTLGTYSVELYRQRPGERELLLATIAEQQRPARNGPWPFVDDGSTGAPIAGTSYRAVIVDPRGRRSAPSPARRVSR